MAAHLWTILCSQAIVNSLTNNLSLIDIVEEVAIGVTADVDPEVGLPSESIVPVSTTLVSLFERSDLEVSERAIGKLSLISPSGRTIDTNFDIDLSVALRARCILAQNGLPIKEPGTYLFRVSVESVSGSFVEVASVPLVLKMSH